MTARTVQQDVEEAERVLVMLERRGMRRFANHMRRELEAIKPAPETNYADLGYAETEVRELLNLDDTRAFANGVRAVFKAMG